MPRGRHPSPKWRSNRAVAFQDLTITMTGDLDLVFSGATTGDALCAGRQLFVDPNGSTRNLDLPPEADSQGMELWIYNAGILGEDITVREDSGTTTVGVLTAKAMGFFVCDGTNWRAGLLVETGATPSNEMLLGDNLAVSYRFREAANAYLTFVTTNGSEAIVFGKALKSTAGMTVILDLSDGATGESDILIADNLASAFEIRQAANSYLTFVTTNSSEAILFGQPLKSTAGMTAVLDLSSAATGESDILLADALASAFEIRQAANVYLTLATTDGAEKVEFGKNIGRSSTSRDLTHHTRWEDHDDLFGKADTEIDHRWILNSGSDGAATDPAIDTAQAGGVWQLVTGAGDGTTAVDASSMVWADLPVRLDTTGGITVVEARIRAKTSIANLAIGFGLTDSTALEEPFSNSADTITSNATDAVGFLYDTDATTDEWWGCAVDTGADDAGNATTGVVPAVDTWQILRIEISNDGATINFFIDNAVTADLALSGAAGVGSGVTLYPYVVACGDGTASRTVDVDWVRVEAVR